MKNNSIFTFSQNIWWGDSISVYFFVCIFEKQFCCATPPPSDAMCLDQNRIFNVKKREDRMVKDESIQRVEIKKKLRPYSSTSHIEAKPSTVATGVRRSGQCYIYHQNEHWKNDCTEKTDQNLCRFAVACLERNQLKATDVNTCKAIVIGLEK